MHFVSWQEDEDTFVGVHIIQRCVTKVSRVSFTWCVLPCSGRWEGTADRGPWWPQGATLWRLEAAPWWGRIPHWGTGSTGRIPTAGGNEEVQTARGAFSAPDVPLQRKRTVHSFILLNVSTWLTKITKIQRHEYSQKMDLNIQRINKNPSETVYGRTSTRTYLCKYWNSPHTWLLNSFLSTWRFFYSLIRLWDVLVTSCDTYLPAPLRSTVWSLRPAFLGEPFSNGPLSRERHT